MTNKEKIIKLFSKKKVLSVKEIVKHLEVSKQMVHIVLKQLLDEKKVVKFGKVPKTVYQYRGNSAIAQEKEHFYISDEERLFLLKNFILITPVGELLEGIDGFDFWCKKRQVPTLKTMNEFIATKEKYRSYYNELNIIDGSKKLKKTYGKNTFLDQVFYLDFYAIERFGKTRLGTILHYAKQGQNKFLMQKMMHEIVDPINQFIQQYQPDAVCFVPWTIRRELQIMKFIQESLNLSLPAIEILKISGIIPVPQKSLNKLEDRIMNAESTFAITDTRKFNKVLLIDDAIGSGSTMNQIAEKLKTKEVAQEVIGLAVVGSFKGFDVITDI